jgi:hypothetical protein
MSLWKYPLIEGYGSSLRKLQKRCSYPSAHSTTLQNTPGIAYRNKRLQKTISTLSETLVEYTYRAIAYHSGQYANITAVASSHVLLAEMQLE